MTELIYTKYGGEWIGAVLALDQGLLTRDDYPRLYAQFAKACGPKIDPDFVSMDTLYPMQEWHGIHWTERLGRNGCAFTLLALPGRNAADIPRLKTKLRRERDVTSIHTIQIARLIEFEYQPKPTCK